MTRQRLKVVTSQDETDGSTYLVLELLQWMDSRVMAWHEQMMASRIAAPQLHVIPPITGINRRSIIKQSTIGRKAVASACLQVRTGDAFLSERCESSSCSCMKFSTLCVSGKKLIHLTKSIYLEIVEQFKSSADWRIRPWNTLTREGRPGRISSLC